ncbi:hypothetical protein SLEP1_g36873 [Rubroshorea leprosula]|uniref:Reverse transcriptase zinc-binding domain-containing protein n=1 Tax=Rubroshorea leprosula TaxID=152421 RepID=A0AAV5KT29_9ROSI|nr:hypothetical protein SLEP1_g36873 [Rubroshorea leprosula]
MWQGIRTKDATCVLCGAENETRDHLFFSCSYSRTVWDVISSMLEVPSTFSWQSALSWLCHKAKRKSLYSSLIRLAWCAAIYHIWIERNTRIHKRTFKSEFAIVSKIQIDVRDKVGSLGGVRIGRGVTDWGVVLWWVLHLSSRRSLGEFQPSVEIREENGYGSMSKGPLVAAEERVSL